MGDKMHRKKLKITIAETQTVCGRLPKKLKKCYGTKKTFGHPLPLPSPNCKEYNFLLPKTVRVHAAAFFI